MVRPVLLQVPLFSALSAEEVGALDAMVAGRHYRKGETVFRQGDPGNSCTSSSRAK